MADKTGIEWTDATWNVVSGCTRVSEGCRHCYIERTPPFRMAGRRFDSPEIGGTTGVLLHEDRLGKPLSWRKPRRVFVNSLSDLFHDSIPAEYIAEVWSVMALAERHTFQILTKRPTRMRSLLNSDRFLGLVTDAIERRDPTVAVGPGIVLDNVWLGVSVEDQAAAELRIPKLLETPAAVRFLSCEPLLGPIDLLGDVEQPGPAIVRTGVAQRTDYGTGVEYDVDDQVGIDWVIAGGESGRGARPMHPDWARSLRDQCTTARVPYLFKQWGQWRPVDHQSRMPSGVPCPVYDRNGTFVNLVTEPGGWPGFEAARDRGWQMFHRAGKHAAGRGLDGREWSEFPEATHV